MVVLLGLAAGAAMTQARSGSTGKRSGAGREQHDLEQFDIVGENKPGPLHVRLGNAAFPNRTLSLTMPRRNDLASTAVHVYEDGQAVSGVTVTDSGASAITSRYLLRYVSVSPTGDHEVELSVTVDGVGVRDIDYPSPPARSAVIAGSRQSFWGSGLGLVAVSLLAALLLALALLVVFLPRQKRGDLRRRVGNYTVTVAQEVNQLPDGPRAVRLPALERLLSGMSWWPRFQVNVEIARFNRSAVELVAITAVVTVLMALLIGAAVGTVAVWLIVLPLGPFVLHSIVRHRLRRQRELFGDQLAAHIEELASAMRAGHGLASALAVLAQSATEPSRGEWGRVVADERLGKPLDEAMHSMARRIQSSEIEQVALVASLHHQTGGNMAEVLERVADGVRERADLRRELNALTAQARLSRWVVSGLPPGLVGIITLLNHAYMRPLFATTGGIVMLCICTGLVIIGSLVMRKLTDIKV